MKFDISNAYDNIKDGTKEITETAHDKTSKFHEKYVSEVIPDCGKYGDAAKFVAEMVPGVAEYNDIRNGDWTAFAIDAGLDLVAIGAAAFTFGAGYGAVKGGEVAAKAGVKVCVKEVAEAGTKKAVKEVAEKGAKKMAKEVVEEGAEKIVKEGSEKIVKEAIEEGTEKIIKEGAEKATKEIVEEGTEKAVKEIAEEGIEKTAKETFEAGSEKAIKETTENGIEATEKKSFELFTTTEERIDFAKNSDGKWLGEAGNSEFRPNKIEAQQTLDKYRQKGIEYLDGNPNFERVSESTLKIDNMTSSRPNNFRQADIRCADQWNIEGKMGKTDWTPRDVSDWRSENKFSWHERVDRETMDLVPREIHDECKHFGGVAECKRAERASMIGGFDE